MLNFPQMTFNDRLKNKWVRLIIWAGAVLLTACPYYGWQHLSLLMYEDGAYAWLCSPEEIAEQAAANLANGVDSSFLCADQFNAVGSLYTYASSAEFVGGLFAGVLFDNFGPRLCGIIGEVLFFCGYAMLIWSSKSVQMYIPGAIIVGLCANFVAFPMFILAEVWPARKQLILASVLAVQAAATAIMPLMYVINHAANWSLSTSMLIYLLVCAPFAVFYILSLPRNRIHMKQEIAIANDEEYIPEDAKAKSGWTGFLRCLVTVEWIGILLWYVVQIMIYNAYNVNLRSFAGEAVANYLGWIMPVQAICVIVFGWINDKVATLWLCGTLSVLNIIFMALGFANNDGVHYLSATLYAISNAYIYTTKYTYVSEIFSPEHFGKLSGAVGFAAGILQLFNILIDQSEPSYQVLFGSWIAVSVVFLGGVVYLYYRQKVLHINYVDDEIEVSETTDTCTTETVSSESV